MCDRQPLHTYKCSSYTKTLFGTQSCGSWLTRVPSSARSFASGFQALSVALMLPGIASLRGIGWQNLPGYLVEGAH